MAHAAQPSADEDPEPALRALGIARSALAVAARQRVAEIVERRAPERFSEGLLIEPSGVQ
jgi:hypothetical protein